MCQMPFQFAPVHDIEPDAAFAWAGKSLSGLHQYHQSIPSLHVPVWAITGQCCRPHLIHQIESSSFTIAVSLCSFSSEAVDNLMEEESETETFPCVSWIIYFWLQILTHSSWDEPHFLVSWSGCCGITSTEQPQRQRGLQVFMWVNGFLPYNLPNFGMVCMYVLDHMACASWCILVYVMTMCTLFHTCAWERDLNHVQHMVHRVNVLHSIYPWVVICECETKHWGLLLIRVSYKNCRSHSAWSFSGYFNVRILYTYWLECVAMAGSWGLALRIIWNLELIKLTECV